MANFKTGHKMDQLIKLLINVIKEIASAAFLLDSSEAREHMDRLREFDGAIGSFQDLVDYYDMNLFCHDLEDQLERNMFRNVVRGNADTTDYTRRNLVLDTFNAFTSAIRWNDPMCWITTRERFVRSLEEEAQP